MGAETQRAHSSKLSWQEGAEPEPSLSPVPAWCRPWWCLPPCSVPVQSTLSGRVCAELWAEVVLVLLRVAVALGGQPYCHPPAPPSALHEDLLSARCFATGGNRPQQQAAVFHVSFKKCMYRAKTEVRIENKICITQIHNYKLTVPTVWLFTYLCSYSVSKGKYIFHIVAVTTVPAFFMSRDISDTSLWS